MGRPQSNACWRRSPTSCRFAGPSKIAAGDAEFTAEQSRPDRVYPNPLNPSRYVVLNSGFTFRDYAYLNNARQVPMLPDWAIVDLTTSPGSIWPGKIAAADFFDERGS